MMTLPPVTNGDSFMTGEDLIVVTICARLRAQLAAAEGDLSRYWRELASAMRMLGESEAADSFDRMSVYVSQRKNTDETAKLQRA